LCFGIVVVADCCGCCRFDGRQVVPLTSAERMTLLATDAAWRRQGKGAIAMAYRPGSCDNNINHHRSSKPSTTVAREHYDVLESEQLAARVSAGAVRGHADDVDLLASLVGGQVSYHLL
jgi:hypothetical protein